MLDKEMQEAWAAFLAARPYNGTFWHVGVLDPNEIEVFYKKGLGMRIVWKYYNQWRLIINQPDTILAANCLLKAVGIPLKIIDRNGRTIETPWGERFLPFMDYVDIHKLMAPPV